MNEAPLQLSGWGVFTRKVVATMRKKRDLVAEIEEIRQRRGSEIHPVTIPFRMSNIAGAFQSSPSLDPEFLRYVPILRGSFGRL